MKVPWMYMFRIVLKGDAVKDRLRAAVFEFVHIRPEEGRENVLPAEELSQDVILAC
ncbi:MAG: hypothetical protein II855_00685 [Candidatus Methanomethylophilaceae archaeon]|nr:hypothetical protein [Candidatus Methanomethylophilaceae archaeon]